MFEEVLVAIFETVLTIWQGWLTNLLALPALLWQLALLGLFGVF